MNTIIFGIGAVMMGIPVLVGAGYGVYRLVPAMSNKPSKSKSNVDELLIAAKAAKKAEAELLDAVIRENRKYKQHIDQIKTAVSPGADADPESEPSKDAK